MLGDCTFCLVCRNIDCSRTTDRRGQSPRILMSWILPAICTSQIHSRLCAPSNHLSFYSFQSQDFRKVSLTLQRGSGALGLNIMGGYTVSPQQFLYFTLVTYLLIADVSSRHYFYLVNVSLHLARVSFFEYFGGPQLFFL